MVDVSMDQPSREDGVRLLIDRWFTRVREVQAIHYACMRRFSRFHYVLGIPALVLATAVGTAVFASLEREATEGWKITWGLLSVLAAVLTALQTFLGFSQRAEKHRQTGAGYGAVLRQLELLKALPRSEKEVAEELQAVKKGMDDLAEHAPEVPSSIAAKVWGDPLSGVREEVSKKHP